MIKKDFEIKNETGLHTRPGNDFVKTAKQFSSSITVTKNGCEIDAKSLLKLMKADISKGDVITIACNGTDEANAMEILGEYIINLKD